jgi:hypothetical protein
MSKRVNFPMTLDQLIAEAIKAKSKYGGGKYVLLSTDEEGNGFHECYYTFSLGDETMRGLFDVPNDLNPKDCVTLG